MDFVWIVGQIFVTLVELSVILIGLGILIEIAEPGKYEIASKVFDTFTGITYEDEEEL